MVGNYSGSSWAAIPARKVSPIGFDQLYLVAAFTFVNLILYQSQIDSIWA